MLNAPEALIYIYVKIINITVCIKYVVSPSKIYTMMLHCFQ